MSESRTESALGARLRAARESRGLDVESAGREAGVPSRYLRMLEEGEFPAVADPAYLTHFLRRYARFLGLDAEASARDFLSETEPEATARRTGRVPTPGNAALRARVRRPLVPGWVAYALVLIAGLAGLFTVVRMQQEREAETQAIAAASRPLHPPASRPAAPPRAEAPVRHAAPARTASSPDPAIAPGRAEGTSSRAEQAPRERPEPVRELRKDPAPARAAVPQPAETGIREAQAVAARPEARPAAEPSPSGPASGTVPAEPAPEAVAADPAPGAAATLVARPDEPVDVEAAEDAPGPPFELSLTATSRQVWIWVSVDGGPREAVSLEEGETVVFRAEQRYVLSIDDAGGIAGSLNGMSLPSFGADAQARRNVVIPSVEFGGFATSRG